MSTTPPMLVRSVSISTSNTITFRFKNPFQSSLFLGLLSIAKNTGLSGVAGLISPGSDANHGGSANLQMATSLYDAIVSFVNSNQGQGLFLELVYDSATLTPTEVICGTTQPLLAAASHSTDSVLSDKLDSLNQNLQTLVSALSSIAPAAGTSALRNGVPAP